MKWFQSIVSAFKMTHGKNADKYLRWSQVVNDKRFILQPRANEGYHAIFYNSLQITWHEINTTCQLYFSNKYEIGNSVKKSFL